MRRKLIAGNWKMNGLLDDGTTLARGLRAKIDETAANSFDLLICPPATLIAPVAQVIAGSAVGLGGQDCHPAGAGAHTGDISAAMLADLGCSHVIVGHSERRQDHAETDSLVCAKAEAAAGAGLTAIVCVGETADQRDAGRALAIIEEQLAGSLPEPASGPHPVVAYEPVWAIGTGRTPSPDEIGEVHAHIRGRLAQACGREASEAMRILYGGSLKPDNATVILAVPDVDGGLIGGASLKVDDFWGIATSCP